MRNKIRFVWNATRGHRLAPWRSPYLLWRIETYTGVKMKQIGFLEFWEFMWRERNELLRFLRWTGEMDRYAHPKPKSSKPETMFETQPEKPTRSNLQVFLGFLLGIVASL